MPDLISMSILLRGSEGFLLMGSGLFLVCRVPHPNVCASMDMGVDVFRFSEVGIKVDGFIGSAIVYFIGTFKQIKNEKIKPA